MAGDDQAHRYPDPRGRVPTRRPRHQAQEDGCATACGSPRCGCDQSGHRLAVGGVAAALMSATMLARVASSTQAEMIAHRRDLVSRGMCRASSAGVRFRAILVTHSAGMPSACPGDEVPADTGSSGVLLGNTNIPPLKPPADRIYLLGFNGGDSGPTYWHWVAGIGTREAIQYWVLSDAHNEVKGKPKQITTLVLDERKVEICASPCTQLEAAWVDTSQRSRARPLLRHRERPRIRHRERLGASRRRACAKGRRASLMARDQAPTSSSSRGGGCGDTGVVALPSASS